MGKEHCNNENCQCKECLKKQMAEAMDLAITRLQNVRDCTKIDHNYQKSIDEAIDKTNQLTEVLRRISADEKETNGNNIPPLNETQNFPINK